MINYRIFILAMLLGGLLFVLSTQHHTITPTQIPAREFWTDQV